MGKFMMLVIAGALIWAILTCLAFCEEVTYQFYGQSTTIESATPSMDGKTFEVVKKTKIDTSTLLYNKDDRYYDQIIYELKKEIYGIVDGKIELLEVITGEYIPERIEKIPEKIVWPTPTPKIFEHNGVHYKLKKIEKGFELNPIPTMTPIPHYFQENTAEHWILDSTSGRSIKNIPYVTDIIPIRIKGK